MKLSEAIRMGAKDTLPLRGAYFQYKDSQEAAHHACALGCAFWAEYEYIDYNVQTVSDLIGYKFPILKTILTEDQLPNVVHSTFKNGDFPISASVQNVIANLNDRKGWTREKIADWVETLEK